MSGNNLDLAQIFTLVANNLAQNQSALNQADTANHDHGDNIVQIFNTISKTVQSHKNEPVAQQLAYAGKTLGTMQSGSAQIYAKGLMQASKQFKGKTLDQNTLPILLQALMGGGAPVPKKAANPGMDMLGQLLGGMSGGGGGGVNLSDGVDMNDILSLGGSLLGGQQQSGGGVNLSDGIDMNDILSLGGSLLGGQQQRSSSPLESIIGSFLGNSAVGSGYRAQSGQIIIQTILQLLAGMAAKR